MQIEAASWYFLWKSQKYLVHKNKNQQCNKISQSDVDKYDVVPSKCHDTCKSICHLALFIPPFKSLLNILNNFFPYSFPQQQQKISKTENFLSNIFFLLLIVCYRFVVVIMEDIVSSSETTTATVIQTCSEMTGNDASVSNFVEQEACSVMVR